jgi:hypothetical protein
MMTARGWSAFFTPVAVLAAPFAHATDYLTVAQAQEQLFPGARFSEQILKFTGEQRDRIKASAGVRQRQEELKLWRAEKDGKLQGWLIIDEVIGKHEFITYATAIGVEGKVHGIEITSYRETHGGQIRDQSWRKQFVGKTLADPFKLDQDVQNISGATLSCRNVMDGVKRLLVIHQMFLKA